MASKSPSSDWLTGRAENCLGFGEPLQLIQQGWREPCEVYSLTDRLCKCKIKEVFKYTLPTREPLQRNMCKGERAHDGRRTKFNISTRLFSCTRLFPVATLENIQKNIAC